MSEKEVTRRATLAGIATALAGCSTDQKNNNPPPQQNQTPNQTEQPKQNQTDNQENNQENNQEENTEQQNNTWNWNNVLEKEQEAKEKAQIDEVVNAALNGENIGENLEDIDNNAYEYSHGGQTWDLQHFQNLNIDNLEDFKTAVGDALTVANHYMNTKKGDFNSEWNTEMGATAEKIIEKIHNIDNLQIWGQSSDQHGFNTVLSENHGVWVADGATPAIGRAGTQPLKGTPGNDIISQYKDTWIENSDSNSVIKTSLLQNFLTNGVYTGAVEADEKSVGYHMDHLTSLVDKYKAENSGEFLWNVHRPAVATTVNRLARDIEEEETLIMIDPDSIEDLPDLREYDNFQNYKTELEQHTETINKEESYGKIWPE